MLPDRVSNPGPLTYEPGALPTGLCGPALNTVIKLNSFKSKFIFISANKPGRVAQSVGHLTRTSGVLGSILGLATNFRFSFSFFKKGSCQLLAKVCAQSTG